MSQVQTSLVPFNRVFQKIDAPEGVSIQEIVDIALPQNFKGVEVIVSVGDQVIPRENWATVRPKEHSLVSVNAVPAGDGGGQKNPLATVIAVALIAGAPYAAAALAPTATAAVAAGTATAGQLAAYGAVRIGISMVGFLAVSMLSSTPRQRDNGVRSYSDETTQFIEGATNAINKFGVIPVNLGVNRMVPPQGALPYTETSDNDQYVRQLFCYGYGNLIVENLRFGETSIDEYSDVEIEQRLDGNLNLGTTLYSNDVFQEAFSVLLSNAAGFVVRTTQQDVNEAVVDITFARGLAVYDEQGSRASRTVDFEISFAPTGTTDWSTGDAEKTFPAQTVTAPNPVKGTSTRYQGEDIIVTTTWSNTEGIIILNLSTGEVQIKADKSTPVPEGWLRIGSYVINNPQDVSPDLTVTDERAPNTPTFIKDATSFVMTPSGLDLDVSVGTVTGLIKRVTDATGSALRVSYRMIFPSIGQYDIRIRRTTADSTSDRVLDEATLTAIKSVSYVEPVKQDDVSGAAMRIRATDQLNGTVDKFNADVSTVTLTYDPDSDAWSDEVTSNPADLFRYVLQSPAFVKALPDSRIDLEKLKEWWIYCRDNGLTYNRLIDYETSVDDVLNDIAAAGFATLNKVNGIYSVIIDNERSTISAVITPRNSWGYSGNINYPEIPHALRVGFRNKEKGSNTDEVIVYNEADGYDETNATEFERLDFPSCDNAALAYIYGRRYFATAKLQPETHSVNMDFENLTFNRGDRVSLTNDIILVGTGQGRIKSFIYDDDITPTQIEGFIVDDQIEIPSANQFATRIRPNTGEETSYHLLQTVIGVTDTFTFVEPIPIAEDPEEGSLCTFVEDGKELDVIVSEIKPINDYSAKVVCLNYAPERFDATGVIPDFESNITIPLSLQRPQAPLLDGEVISNETALVRQPDGSFLTRMLIPIRNRNLSNVITSVRIRITGGTQWTKPETYGISPSEVILTGLQEKTAYDIHIFYQSAENTQLVSQPLELNGQVFVGVSTPPSDVEGFMVSFIGDTGSFEWSPNNDIDLSHYMIRFSSLTTGATWENSQILADDLKTNRVTLPTLEGTYLIKAFDYSGNESANATTIISFDTGTIENSVETLVGQPDWTGTKTNTLVENEKLIINDVTQVGYYYFPQVDLSEIYNTFVTSSLSAVPGGYVSIRNTDSIRSLAKVRGVDGVLIRAVDSIRSLPNTRGFSASDYSVKIQIRTSDDALTWTDWTDVMTGFYLFRYAEFRLVLESFNLNVNVFVSTAEITLKMPNRFESEEDVDCPVAGVTIAYENAFKNNPSVNITLQDGEVDDRLEYVSKNSQGFTLKVYNATSASYVQRTFDYTAAGYGKEE